MRKKFKNINKEKAVSK